MSVEPTRAWFTFALVWRGAVLLVCTVGLLTGGWGVPFLSPQSNILVFGYLAGALYWMVRRRTVEAPAPVLRGIVTLTIVFVGVISHWTYHGGENPLPGLIEADPETALLNWSAFLVHYAVPALMLIDWIVFGPHRVVSWRRALWWISYPLGYAAVMIVRSILFPDVFARYPVAFLDPELGGWGAVLLTILPLIGLALVLGAALWALDWVAGARASDRQGAPTPRPSPR